MDKQERASYMRELIKLYRKQGMSANKARQLAGEAMRETAQGQQWQDKAQRKADKLQRFMDKAIVEEFAGVTVITLAPKGTRRTYKNNGCRITSRAKIVSNALWADIATKGGGRDKTVLRGQDSGNLALTKTVCADNVKRQYHMRNCALVLARRYLNRQAIKAGFFAKRSTPDKPAIVWQVCDFTSDYPATCYPIADKIARYNNGLQSNFADLFK